MLLNQKARSIFGHQQLLLFPVMITPAFVAMQHGVEAGFSGYLRAMTISFPGILMLVSSLAILGNAKSVSTSLLIAAAIFILFVASLFVWRQIGHFSPRSFSMLNATLDASVYVASLLAALFGFGLVKSRWLANTKLLYLYLGLLMFMLVAFLVYRNLAQWAHIRPRREFSAWFQLIAFIYPCIGIPLLLRD